MAKGLGIQQCILDDLSDEDVTILQEIKLECLVIEGQSFI